MGKRKHTRLTSVAGQELAAIAYREALLRSEKALANLALARMEFCSEVPVGQTVMGLRHVRVHNLEPQVEALKNAGLWRRVAEMQVNTQKLRKATDGWTVKQLRTVATIKTHHRVMDVRKAEK